MNPLVMQGGTLVLLALIFVLFAALVGLLAISLRAVRRDLEAVLRLQTSRDEGPALHAILQAAKETNKLLHNIDQRLQKLEALEKVQLANWTSHR